MTGNQNELTLMYLSIYIFYQNVDILSEYYDDVNDIDLFIGGILEPSSGDSMLGETFKCIVGEQFVRLKVRTRRG